MQERNICIAWFVLVFIHVHSLFCQSVSWTRRSWMRWRPRPGDTIFESFVRLEISETSLPNPFWFSPFGQAVLSPQAIVLRYDAGGTKFGQIWVNSQWWVDWMVRNISNNSQTIQMYNIWFYGHMRRIPVTCVQWDPMYQHASLFEKLYPTCHWAKNYRKRFSIYAVWVLSPWPSRVPHKHQLLDFSLRLVKIDNSSPLAQAMRWILRMTVQNVESFLNGFGQELLGSGVNDQHPWRKFGGNFGTCQGPTKDDSETFSDFEEIRTPNWVAHAEDPTR